MSLVRRLVRRLLLISLALAPPTAIGASATCRITIANWNSLRGVNINAGKLKQEDLVAIRSAGATVIRLSFSDMPIIRKRPPYEINRDAVKRLTQVEKWASELGLYVIIDPHTVPGTARPTNTEPSDELWRSPARRQDIIRLWQLIVNRQPVTNSKVLGYDVLNEPTPPGVGQAAADQWNTLLQSAIDVIRAKDHCTYLIIEPAEFKDTNGQVLTRAQANNYLHFRDPANRAALSPHFYLPYAFTYQGTHGRPEGLVYPGMINAKQWDSSRLKELLETTHRYSVATGLPVFIGEFGADIYAGPSGARYVSDLASLFDSYQWGWAAHIYGESPEWDVRVPFASKPPHKEQIVGPRSRWEALQAAFKH